MKMRQTLKNKKNKYRKHNKTTRHKTNKKNKSYSDKTKNIVNEKINHLQCSPKAKKNDFSCFSDESLYQLRDMWNARHPDALISTNDTKEIWTTMQNNLKSTCNKETCWLKQN